MNQQQTDSLHENHSNHCTPCPAHLALVDGYKVIYYCCYFQLLFNHSIILESTPG